ncbi:bumetanide-sensitive sodium-(potassium)-chloride cotransporter-like [Chironomus tepperi]|uniref:bumetanide-sensitive sodium-(potassium)-chloride cotransporter-like n=1 Tax=Chironomus tepperi TaxID=113505 RepID=UPI00391F6901
MNSRFQISPVPNLNLERSIDIEDENDKVDGLDRKVSLAQLTREKLPRLDHFRLSKRLFTRPSIGELYGDQNQRTNQDEVMMAGHNPHFRLGWIQGVLIPVLLNIYGVMLFLRMGWIVAQSGIIESTIIIGVSAVICIITTLSLSALCTNGDVRSGGIYYIVSRSLGPEFGASLGVIFAFANAVAASMNTIGFCDSLNDLLSKHGYKIIDGGINDTRIIGTVAILIMIIVCATGMEWEVKAQNFLLLAIVAAVVDFMVGTILGPSDQQALAEGFTGFSEKVLEQNLKRDYRFSEGLDQNFFTVFSIFFPSVTGIQAGANICGDLKDPASAIPKGTISALFISMATYLGFVFIVGSAAVRDGSGIVSEIANQSLPYNFACAANHTCEFGLHNNFSEMQVMSYWPTLIYIGCFAATLSTALTNLLSVPRLIQALGVDRIYPGFIFFAKPYGKVGEPYRGYVLTFIVSVAFLLIADLNAVAPLITNFYLAAYAFVNFCTFHAAFVQPLGWRPTFKYYNKWLSLFGFVICVVIMFVLSWQASLVTVSIVFALYLLVHYRQPDANWGSSAQEQAYKNIISTAHRLQETGGHVKNYHPQILVLAGNPFSRPPLIDLAHKITKNSSLLMVGDVRPEKMTSSERAKKVKEAYKYFNDKNIKAFYNLIDDVSVDVGIKLMIQSSGFGQLSPNIVLMGYQQNWAVAGYSSLKIYYSILHNIFSYRVSVAILRMPHGLDYSLILNSGLTNLGYAQSSNGSLNGLDDPPMTPTSPKSDMSKKSIDPKNMSKEDIEMNYFNIKQDKGTIDVWWLYDDGGLTMLIPYIMTMRANWAKCKIRVFALTNRQQELEVEEQNMIQLLKKLRIDFSSLVMLQGISDLPKEGTTKLHSKVLSGFREGENDQCFVTNEEFEKMRDKTNRQLRLREMLREHSRKANLIVMSLPMPRQGEVSAPLYMSWLEVLSAGMPPMLFVRGNQTSVLTFYS